MDDAKSSILKAANNVIYEKGITGFTIEEVANRAGVSKGGLLHHYKSKDELIGAMIENLVQKLNKATKDRVRHTPDYTEADMLCASVIECFNAVKAHSEINAGLFAAAALNRDLLGPIIEDAEETMKRIGSSKDPVFSLIAILASECLVFMELLGLDVVPEELKDKVLIRLLEGLEDEKGRWS